MIGERKQMDHREIGKQMKLFTASNPVGKGLPLLDEGRLTGKYRVEMGEKVLDKVGELKD